MCIVYYDCFSLLNCCNRSAVCTHNLYIACIFFFPPGELRANGVLSSPKESSSSPVAGAPTPRPANKLIHSQRVVKCITTKGAHTEKGSSHKTGWPILGASPGEPPRDLDKYTLEKVAENSRRGFGWFRRLQKLLYAPVQPALDQGVLWARIKKEFVYPLILRREEGFRTAFRQLQVGIFHQTIQGFPDRLERKRQARMSAHERKRQARMSTVSS